MIWWPQIKPSELPKARENAIGQVVIGFRCAALLIGKGDGAKFFFLEKPDTLRANDLLGDYPDVLRAVDKHPLQRVEGGGIPLVTLCYRKRVSPVMDYLALKT